MTSNDPDLTYLTTQALDDLSFYDVAELNSYFHCAGKMIFLDVQCIQKLEKIYFNFMIYILPLG